ncbi:hypothetical protein BV25DRAFT_1070422 [Artomyces pyxidatus]|uniref:Uncharacterized protein n=1 Tax=Artomyces pyxidatus TaxID=48021 RepID=A0ACB8TFH3_9AGAM|nr:hypothetical protein BV25DRAFT_1070422 [Artomyces pyxidatus]
MATQVQSHNALTDNGVEHGHVDPNGQVSQLALPNFQQSHRGLNQSLDQALDPHLSQVSLDARSHYHSHYPPAHILPPEQSHHPEHFLSYPPSHEIPVQAIDQPPVSTPKRKQSVAAYASGPQKKRRQVDVGFDDDGDEGDMGDGDGAGAGSRHWTDEEKTKLFNWLMGPGEDEHFEALKTKKNTCFRDCAVAAFQGRKTFLAVKGCYERNFVVFKQIFAFETFTANMQQADVDSENEVDRLREYERRIYAARKAGFHVGNLSSRILDHWHRMGWYNTFHSRWHGDPGVRRPPGRARTMGPPSSVPNHAQSNGDSHIEPSLRGDESPLLERADAGPPHDRSYEQETPSFASHDPVDSIPSPPHTPSAGPSNQQHHIGNGYTAPPPPTAGVGDPTPANVTAMAQTMMSACMRLLQSQAEDSRVRLEYLRRREERDMEEGRLRQETEKKRQEREAADWERLQQNAKIKQKSELATELLSNANVDPSVKQAAGDYLKKLFAND